jgi:hypothetical protein
MSIVEFRSEGSEFTLCKDGLRLRKEGSEVTFRDGLRLRDEGSDVILKDGLRLSDIRKTKAVFAFLLVVDGWWVLWMFLLNYGNFLLFVL